MQLSPECREFLIDNAGYLASAIAVVSGVVIGLLI